MSLVGIVLQARMGSSRLPGKVLKPLTGTPMIGRIVARLRRSLGTKMLIAAVPDTGANDELVRYLESLDVFVFRGSEHDVLDRYVRCAKTFGLDWIVRATGDNPFVDVEECDRLIDMAHADDLDYASAFPEFGSGLPIGIGVEIFSRAALIRSATVGTASNHREHVNEYIHENAAEFRCGVLQAPPEKVAPHLSFTVDRLDQFARAEALVAASMREQGSEEPRTDWLIRFSNLVH